jgi:UDP-2,3-diacylglucosamine hydrolase
VIADLHLDLGRADGAEPFLRWLGSISDLPRLVVLGDLFDVWVGPAQERMPGAPAVLDALRSLVSRGTSVDIVHGNRDFLLDASFAARTGAKVHPRGVIGRIDRAGVGEPAERVVLLHGDELCTRDKAYQRLKLIVRSRPVTGLAPHLPLPVATFIARALRRTSVRALETKPPDTKILQEAACRWHAFAYHAGTVVCGHAHAFRDMRLATGPRWIVLDAFGGDRDVLEVGRDGALRVIPSGALDPA